MKPTPTVVIPATAEASSEYRLAQSKTNLEREGQLKDIGRGFKRGKPLDPSNCIMASPIDGWSPPGKITLVDFAPPSLVIKVNKAFSPEGLAATIAITDTVAGVSETITYDENERLVLEQLEGDRDRGTGEEEGGTNAWTFTEDEKRRADRWSPDFKLPKPDEGGGDGNGE